MLNIKLCRLVFKQPINSKSTKPAYLSTPGLITSPYCPLFAHLLVKSYALGLTMLLEISSTVKVVVESAHQKFRWEAKREPIVQLIQYALPNLTMKSTRIKRTDM